MPGIGDRRCESLVIGVAGREGAASLAKLETANGRLAGELFGDAFTVGRVFSAEARTLYFAPLAETPGLRRGLTIAPGLTVQVTRIDLYDASAEGPGASTWVAMQHAGTQMRAQGLPEVPGAWRAAIEVALGGAA
jgi:hypothetical protein